MPNPSVPDEEVTSEEHTQEPDRAARASAQLVNFWAVFECAPDPYLVLAADPPRFTMVAANDARLHVTMTRREDVIGRPLVEVFPDNPTDPTATGVRNLRASLEEVLHTRKPHRMALQKYDIRKPGNGFEERFWDPLNSPVFDDRGNLIYIIHRVHDVTEHVRATEAHAEEARARREIEYILESITDAFFTVDQAWRFTYVNHRAEQLLQRRREALIGNILWHEFPAIIGTEFEHQYHRAMMEQTAREFVAFLPLGIWVEVRAYPAPPFLSVYMHDISDRKRAEQALRESEERYRLLADMIPQNIWTTDPAGEHTYFSRRWYDFSGATPDESHGEGWLDFIHPDDKERTRKRWQHSLETGEPYSIEYRFRRADGTYRWFLGKAMPLRNDAGDIIKWFGTATDISERMEHEEERERLLEQERAARAEAERQREELERVTQSRTRLMRGFSHDVKNPLGAADGYAALLEEGIVGELSEEQRQSVHRIRSSIEDSLRLINDLLELARAEAGQIQLEVASIDAAALARDVTEDFRGQFDAAGLALEVDAKSPLRINSDPTRVRQVLSNLVSNAVKYTRTGHAMVKAVRQRDDGAPHKGEWVAITVIDTGPGIPKEKQQTIFQEFTRLDPKAPHGAGVGLAISRRIARLLGGDVTVDSEVGRGSKFTLWLPTGNEERGTEDE